MRLGSTPIHEFTIPFDASFVKEFKVTYKQDRKVVLEKYLKDFEIEGRVLSVRLTQEETFLFDEKLNIEVQGRVLTTENNALTSDIVIITAMRCLDREVLE